MYVDLQQFCFHCLPVFSNRLALFQGNTVENSGKGNPESGFKPPPSRAMQDKWLIINNLHGFIKMAGRLN